MSALLENLTHPLPEPLKITFCDSFFLRLRGLMFRKALPENQALWFSGDQEDRVNSAIHMLFMNFDITVVWLDHEQKVVDTHLARRWHPWYIPASKAKYILEAHQSLLDCFHIGDKIKIYDQ